MILLLRAQVAESPAGSQSPARRSAGAARAGRGGARRETRQEAEDAARKDLELSEEEEKMAKKSRVIVRSYVFFLTPS